MCLLKVSGGNTKSGQISMVGTIQPLFHNSNAKVFLPEGSDIIYLNLLGQDVIVLNSLAACRELFDKRSAIYSSRPNMPMINDLCVTPDASTVQLR